MADDPNTGSVVETVVWFCAGICTIALVARSITKARIIRHVGADDAFIWGGFLCFIGQCVAVQMQVQNGLGQDVNQVTPDMQEGELKAEYANYLLYMPVIACAKLSVVSVLRKCALQKKDRLLLYMFEWFLAAWVITSEIVRAFPCELPTPWDYLHVWCIDRQVWVVYFEMINIFTELALIIIPTLNISRMPTTWDKKVLAISFFSARILIIPASICRIVYWLQASNSSNVSYDLAPFEIWTVAIAALEILAACVLYMRPLFAVLETGFATSYPTSPGRMDSPKLGPYSKGSWPFTRMSSIDEDLTGRGTSYEAKVQASFYDAEKSPTGSDEHIHVSRQVDIRTTYPHFDRVHVRSTNMHSRFSDPDALFEKGLPPTPDIPTPDLQRETFLLV